MTGVTKIFWSGVYTFPAALFSSFDPTMPGYQVTLTLSDHMGDTYTYQMPAFVLPGPCVQGHCGWSHNSTFTKWLWRTDGIDIPSYGYIKSVLLKEYPALGQMTVNVNIEARHAPNTPFSVIDAAVSLDGLIDPDGQGDDCVTTGFPRLNA